MKQNQPRKSSAELLTAFSEGTGCGSEFTLEIPVAKKNGI